MTIIARTIILVTHHITYQQHIKVNENNIITNTTIVTIMIMVVMGTMVISIMLEIMMIMITENV